MWRLLVWMDQISYSSALDIWISIWWISTQIMKQSYQLDKREWDNTPLPLIDHPLHWHLCYFSSIDSIDTASPKPPPQVIPPLPYLLAPNRVSPLLSSHLFLVDQRRRAATTNGGRLWVWAWHGELTIWHTRTPLFGPLLGRALALGMVMPLSPLIFWFIQFVHVCLP